MNNIHTLQRKPMDNIFQSTDFGARLLEGLAAANHRSDQKDQNNKILVVANSSGDSSHVSGGRRRAYTELGDLLESDVMGGTNNYNRVINLDDPQKNQGSGQKG